MDNDTKVCQGKDVFERMNYLYQASHLIALKNKTAASYYGNLMVGCAKKAVLRIEPGIKRTVCKSCQSPLIPGETARVRLVSKPMKGVKWTCLACLNTKRYPTKRGYKLWTEQPDSVVQVLDYERRLRNSSTSATETEKNSSDGTESVNVAKN